MFNVKSISLPHEGHRLLPVGTLTIFLQNGHVTSYVRRLAASSIA